jgi:hypothetical protein
VLINTQPFKDIIQPTVNWACEMGTVVDLSKIASFRPNLLCEEPKIDNGLVYYQDRLFPIVHQYDRVPELKKFVQKKYGQEDESEYFIYKV